MLGVSTCIGSGCPFVFASTSPLTLGAGLLVSGRTLLTTSGRGMLHHVYISISDSKYSKKIRTFRWLFL